MTTTRLHTGDETTWRAGDSGLRFTGAEEDHRVEDEQARDSLELERSWAKIVADDSDGHAISWDSLQKIHIPDEPSTIAKSQQS